jgi:hypothetical protein
MVPCWWLMGEGRSAKEAMQEMARETEAQKASSFFSFSLRQRLVRGVFLPSLSDWIPFAPSRCHSRARSSVRKYPRRIYRPRLCTCDSCSSARDWFLASAMAALVCWPSHRASRNLNLTILGQSGLFIVLNAIICTVGVYNLTLANSLDLHRM